MLNFEKLNLEMLKLEMLAKLRKIEKLNQKIEMLEIGYLSLGKWFTSVYIYHFLKVDADGIGAK